MDIKCAFGGAVVVGCSLEMGEVYYFTKVRVKN